MRYYAALLVPVLLAGCGTLPQPFLGKPGARGALLSVPPPPVLIIPKPNDALLGNAAARLYAQDLAAALVAQNVPSVAKPATKLDWRLIAGAQTEGELVVPSFTIIGPSQHVYGHATSRAVGAEAWSDGDAATLNAAAVSAAPELAKQLGAINASVQQSNPLSLENRPAHVLVGRVTGAPGDGDHALALNIKRDLAQQGIVLVDQTHNADFVISGVVTVGTGHTTNAGARSDVVELNWVVRSQSGAFIGKVSQLHDLLPSQVTPYWGDVAVAAAQQASLGIKQVMVNAIPKRAHQRTDGSAHRPQTPAIAAKSPEP